MTTHAAPEAQATRTLPYLIRAPHDWCTDTGLTPAAAVARAAPGRAEGSGVRRDAGATAAPGATRTAERRPPIAQAHQVAQNSSASRRLSSVGRAPAL